MRLKFTTMDQCYKTFSMVIYCHSIIITVVYYFIKQNDGITMEWQ
jgi:hypothetical protein